jgi:hypothetical protein
MRRVFSGLVRGFAVGFVVLALAGPVEALPRRKENSPAEQIVKVFKRWVQTILGDRMSEPKP